MVIVYLARDSFKRAQWYTEVGFGGLLLYVFHMNLGALQQPRTYKKVAVLSIHSCTDI